MNRLVLIAFVLLGVVTAQASEGLTEQYNQGNAVYRKGDYKAAIADYEKVIAEGLHNGDVYYNLGNAYYKAGQLGQAILAYERALKLKPDDEDVRANLQFANAQKADKDPEDDANALTRMLRVVYGFFGVNALTVLCSLCFLGICVSGMGWVFGAARRWVWRLAVVLLCAGLSGCGSLLAFKIHERGVPEAIILSNEVAGRSGPGSDFLKVFTLHEGTKVVIERHEGTWVLVRLASGTGGWLPTDALEQI